MLINVGIIALGGRRWWGDVIYKYNLLYALSQLESRKIAPVVFSAKTTEDDILSMYSPYAGKIVKDSLFDAWSTKWFLSRVGSRLSDNDFLFYKLTKKHAIPVISHLHYAVKGTPDCRTVAWIPDFQHIRLPDMFSTEEINNRNRIYGQIAEKSTLVILSSYDAFNDFSAFAAQFASKARVLHFVSQSSPEVYTAARDKTESKYSIGRKYFFLPNQFWKHKNHKVVFEAVKLLKEDGRDVSVVCSGTMDDRRNTDHVEKLVAFIHSNKLEDNIRLLGMIDKEDLFSLMRNCISCLNPSLFEGWSTTVEEAKSLGKNMILSDIPVHQEQNPPGSVYFAPHDPHELAAVLWQKFNKVDGGPDFELEKAAKETLTKRTREFAQTYQDIVLESLESK